MSNKLAFTVDPRLTDSTKLKSILRSNPTPHTDCKRHPRLLRLVAICMYEAQIHSIPVNPEAAVYQIINHHYID